ncbi:MAG TPA: PAS domain-containing protein, partial [Dissulfurispiraceae bacterium]|nr:PAS domain-containing protein [Dissulfurispiraceae bacterium]
MSEVHENIVSSTHLRQSVEERELMERAFLDALGQPALLISPDGTVIVANNQRAATVGRRSAEIIGMRVYDLMPPDLSAQWKEAVTKVIASRQPSQLDYTRNKREVSAHFRPIAGKSGEVAFVAVCESDVTEQKRTERELFGSRQMLQMVLDNIPQRVFWKDRDCRYLGCNRSFLADAGLGDPCDIVGRDDLDL